ncbi:uncharacterized protein LOC144476461 isoform X2 [Augochlora pura]
MLDVTYLSRWTYWMILTFHVIFKVMGLSTVSLRSGNQKNKRTIFFARTKFGIFYNVFLSSAIAGSSYITLPNLYNTDYDGRTPISATIEMVQATFAIMMMCTILICYAFWWSKLERIWNFLMETEEESRSLKVFVSIKHPFWNFLIIYVIMTTMFISVLMMEYIAYHNGPLVWAVNIMPGFFAACVFYQYYLVISLMTVNFNRVNRAIQSLGSDQTDDFLKSGIHRRRILPKYTIIQGIRRLRNMHDNFCDTCSTISQFYSLPSLFVVMFTFYSLLFNTYYLFQPIVLYNRGLDIIPFIDTVFLIAFLIYPFGLLAAKITDVLNEIERTAIVVHSFLKNVFDQETKSEVTEAVLTAAAESKNQVYRLRIL